MPARALDKKPKILYIEDNPENRMLVRAVLEAAGYTIVEAEDGLAGIEGAIREEPALILLDINLPGVDGYEIVAILKSFPNLASTPVIALTAYAMQGDRQRTLVAGCDGYIQKPINVDAFPRQVAEFLGGKRERVEGREEGVYLRELNQRLVYRLLNQVEELKRLNQHFVRRASQLADLHHAVQDTTTELGVVPMLERLLRGLSQAIGTTSLRVELSEPPGVSVVIESPTSGQPRSVLAGTGAEPTDEWNPVEWTLPLTVRERQLGVMVARHVLPVGAKADEEQLLKIVADQVAIAVENSRLYEGVMRRAAEQASLVEAGRLLTGTLQVSEVLQRLSELVRTRLGADVVRILLRQEAPNEFRLEAQAGSTRAPKESTRLTGDDDEGLVGWIMKHKTTLALTDVLARPALTYRDWIAGEGFRSFLGLPLFLEHQFVGVLTVWYRETHAFIPEELALGEALATSATAAIRNARLYEETQERLRHTETLLAELKRTQAQLIQSTKLAAIGELAANIAHEINNPLTSVLGFASFLAERIPQGQPMREELDLIQEEAGRARDIVRDLLHFSRQREFVPQMTDLNRVLEQTIAMVRRQGALDSISLAEAYAEGLPPVEIDVPRIKQVFLNLVNNAVYVMKDGGSLTLRSSVAGDMVQVEVLDTGTGIAAEHLDRIFEPFFTTKPDVSGTGLGLSVSLGIVQSHGGTIEVKSELGRGSNFIVKLPAKPGATLSNTDDDE
jgi:signal transduction histidine kinase